MKLVLMRRPGALLELVETEAATARGELEPPVESAHQIHGVFKFGFLVGSLDAAIARLEALDVPLRGQVISEKDGSFRSLQVEDPDGNVLQLFERLDGEEEEGR